MHVPDEIAGDLKFDHPVFFNVAQTQLTLCRAEPQECHLVTRNQPAFTRHLCDISIAPWQPRSLFSGKAPPANANDTSGKRRVKRGKRKAKTRMGGR